MSSDVAMNTALPAFAAGDLFPPGARFRAVRAGGRVRLERVSERAI